MCVGCVLFLPALVGDVSGDAVPWIIASSGLELAYFALLALAYARAEMSAVYPLARGSAPVLVLVGSVIALAGSPSVAQVLGVLLVAVGGLAVRGAPRGGTRLGLVGGGGHAGV